MGSPHTIGLPSHKWVCPHTKGFVLSHPQLVRKKHALSRLRDALAWQALPVIQLLALDERVCASLVGTLFGKSALVPRQGEGRCLLGG